MDGLPRVSLGARSYQQYLFEQLWAVQRIVVGIRYSSRGNLKQATQLRSHAATIDSRALSGVSLAINEVEASSTKQY